MLTNNTDAPTSATEKLPAISIVIPVFNESKRIHLAFQELERYFSENANPKTEVIFIDDGSQDDSLKKINEFIAKHPDLPMHAINYRPNRGKGYAVRIGMCAAKGDYALMTDADMSTRLSELKKFTPQFTLNTPIIIGSRKSAGALLIKKQPWARQKLGELYAFLARKVTGLNYADFGCGFKAFARVARDKIFAAARVNRWTFDTEALFLAKKYGYNVAEVGIAWTNDQDTRVRVIRDALESLFDIGRIYYYHF